MIEVNLKHQTPNDAKPVLQAVLSLFDGISCGQIALERAGYEVRQYFASEIKPHAIKCTQSNYPNTIQLGSVLNVKGSDLPKIDDCDLSIRTKNICRMNDFKVIRDLIAYSTKDLMMLHFGKRTISEIQEFLFSKGYYFGS